MSPGTSKGEETKRSVVEEALKTASRVGLPAMTIGALAKRTGMSKSGLYAHFSSKDELMLAVIEEAVRRFVEAIVSPAFKKPRGLPRLEALFDGWVSYVEKLPGGCPLVISGAATDELPPAVYTRAAKAKRDWMDALAHAAQIAIDEGQLRPDTDTELLAFELEGAALAFHQAHRLFRDEGAKAIALRAYSKIIDQYRL